MGDRLDEFLCQARIARERAQQAEGEFKTHWLKVAKMWDLLAEEYSSLRGPGASRDN